MTSFKQLALRTLIFAFLSFGLCHSAAAAIFVKIPTIPGDVTTAGYEALAEDLRIEIPDPDVRSADAGRGVVILSLPRSTATSELIQAALDGHEIPEIEILVPQPSSEGKPMVYLKYKLDRCFVKSWSTSGDADDRPTEEVAFYYNKIAFKYLATKDGRN